MPLTDDPAPFDAALPGQTYAENIVNTVREPLLILRGDLRVQSASRSFYKTFSVTRENTEGRLVYDLGDGQWDIPALRDLLQTILPQETSFDDYEVVHDFPSIGVRTMLLNARRLHEPADQAGFILLAIEDITERRQLLARCEAFNEQLTGDLARQIRITEALQRPLLLEIEENAFPGLSVATLYSAAWTQEAEVGGDFYDAFALADGRIALHVGDVTGKAWPQLPGRRNAKTCYARFSGCTRSTLPSP